MAISIVLAGKYSERELASRVGKAAAANARPNLLKMTATQKRRALKRKNAGKDKAS